MRRLNRYIIMWNGRVVDHSLSPPTITVPVLSFSFQPGYSSLYDCIYISTTRTVTVQRPKSLSVVRVFHFWLSGHEPQLRRLQTEVIFFGTIGDNPVKPGYSSFSCITRLNRLTVTWERCNTSPPPDRRPLASRVEGISVPGRTTWGTFFPTGLFVFLM